MPNQQHVEMTPLSRFARRRSVPVAPVGALHMPRKAAKLHVTYGHGGKSKQEPAVPAKTQVVWHTPPQGTIKQRLTIMKGKLQHKAKMMLGHLFGR